MMNKKGGLKDQVEIDKLGEIRIKESKGFLKQIERETTEIITKIRSHAERNENIRRIQEDKLKGERANKI